MDINVAEPVTPTTISKDPKQPNPSKPRGKRPFFKNNKKDGPPAKRQMASFDRLPEPKLSSTYPLQMQFELATQFSGIRYVTNCFYDLLTVKDGKMTSFFTAYELYYVVLLSVYYRCATITNMAKTSIILGLSDLALVIEDLLLPDAIATYVETFGRVKMSSGATVIPYFRGIADMQLLPDFIDPVTVIRTINQNREVGHLSPYTISGDWSLSSQVIVNYTKSLARVSKNIIEFRKVNYQEKEGRVEFLSCYEVDGHTKLKCFAYDNIDHASCQLGAAMRFRHTSQPDVGVIMEPMFGASDIEADVILTNHFLKSFRASGK
jgi:hypothetical protein